MSVQVLEVNPLRYKTGVYLSQHTYDGKLLCLHEGGKVWFGYPRVPRVGEDAGEREWVSYEVKVRDSRSRKGVRRSVTVSFVREGCFSARHWGCPGSPSTRTSNESRGNIVTTSVRFRAFWSGLYKNRTRGGSGAETDVSGVPQGRSLRQGLFPIRV